MTSMAAKVIGPTSVFDGGRQSGRPPKCEVPVASSQLGGHGRYSAAASSRERSNAIECASVISS